MNNASPGRYSMVLPAAILLLGCSLLISCSKYEPYAGKTPERPNGKLLTLNFRFRFLLPITAPHATSAHVPGSGTITNGPNNPE
jgi:hypothetical protein